MAARINPKHDQRTREKIKTSQLINRLQKFVKSDAETAKKMMTTQQVNAALGLLKKTLPDVSAVELGVEVDATVKVNRVELVAPEHGNSTD